MTARVKRHVRASQTSEAVDAADVRERILKASIELFGRKGYAGVSVREICRAADTTAPMIYYYFGSKRGLYQSLLEQTFKARRRALEKAFQSTGTPLERLRSVLEAWAGIDQEPEVEALRLLFLRELFGLGTEAYKRSVEAYDRYIRHALRTILQEGMGQGVFRPVRAEMAVLAITGIINTFSRRIALGAPLTMADAVEQVMDCFIHGIAAKSTDGESSDSSAPTGVHHG